MLNALALALALVAPKDPTSKEAERLAKKSIVEYNVGDFDQALDDVTRAYKLTPAPGLLYNLGQCHRALHHWEKAEFFYRGYLREKPDASNRAAVEDLIQEMEAKQHELSAPPSGTTATPPTTITVVAPPPLPPPGAPLVTAGDSTTVPLVSAPDNIHTSTEPKVEGRAVESTHSRALSYALMGVAGAGAVLTGVSGGVLIDYQSYYGSLKPGSPPVSYQTFQSKMQTAQIFNVLIFVGIGLAVGGLGSAVLTW